MRLFSGRLLRLGRRRPNGVYLVLILSEITASPGGLPLLLGPGTERKSTVSPVGAPDGTVGRTVEGGEDEADDVVSAQREDDEEEDMVRRDHTDAQLGTRPELECTHTFHPQFGELLRMHRARLTMSAN